MNGPDFEAQLRTIVAGMKYPPTPDIAGSVMARLRPAPHPRFAPKAVAWSLTLLLVLVSSLLLIPPARAAILEFIQVGVVRIFRAEPTPLPPPTQIPPTGMIPVTATPAATQEPLIPILKDLAGRMTLEQAQRRVTYPLLLPAYPPDLGKPDYVFVQDVDNAMTVLVWLDPQRPDQVLMSLHFLPSGSWAIKKVEPTVIQETRVHNHYAVWTTGPYVLRLENNDLKFTRLINGHVLIWEEGEITYRLETALSMEEAVKIAESLAPIP